MNDDGTSAWALDLIEKHRRAAAESLCAFCAKPKSRKTLHRARKDLARLRAALADLSDVTAPDPQLQRQADELYKCAGKVRDADVLLIRVKNYCKKAVGDESRELNKIERDLRKRRKKARRRLGALIDDLPELAL